MVIENRSISGVLDRAKSDDESHVFRISDESIDSHGTVFRADGWKFDQYKNNPIVTYGHPDMNSTDEKDVIGRSEVFQVGTETFARITYDLGCERAKDIKRKVDGGFLNACSIRASVAGGEWGDKERGENPDVLYFNDHSLLDWGIVMHASNKRASKVEDVARTLNIEKRVEEEEEEVVIDEKLVGRAKEFLNK